MGDIIGMYELQHQALSSAAPVAGNGKQVERYAVEAAEAPALNGEKKNSQRVS